MDNLCQLQRQNMTQLGKTLRLALDTRTFVAWSSEASIEENLILNLYFIHL